MPHEIETHNGISFYADSRKAVNGRTATWHQLGQPIGHCMTVEEAMDAAKLGGWDVRKVPLSVTAEVSDAGVWPELAVNDKFAVVRNNPVTGLRNYLGVVGNTYKPIQNEEHSAFLQTLVDEFGASLETAASLREGQDVFITMKLPKTITVTGNDGKPDTTELYIAALNNHSGRASFRVILTPIRIVCANTQQWAESTAQATWKVRHTATAMTRVQVAREMLGLVWESTDTVQAEFQRMADTEMSVDAAKEFTNKLFDVAGVEPGTSAATQRQNKADAVFNLFTNSPTVANIAGTRFAAYNAVTEWADFFAPVRGGGPNASDEVLQNLRAARSIDDLDTGTGIKATAFKMLSLV
ncbi:MAG: DUF932 domain-containing protein [Fluviibacter sp.]